MAQVKDFKVVDPVLVGEVIDVTTRWQYRSFKDWVSFSIGK